MHSEKFIFKIHKELLQLKSKNQITQFNKWARDLSKLLSKNDIQMGNKYM